MRFDSLKRDPWKRPKRPGPAARPDNWRETFIYELDRWIREYGLTSDDIEDGILNSTMARAVVERGGVVNENDGSALSCVMYLGWPMIKQGWSIVPQDRPGTFGAKNGGRDRKPSGIPHTIITSKQGHTSALTYPFLPTEWRDKRMNLREFIQMWRLSSANLAIQCCAASGHIRALDIDCPDPAVAARVRDLAFQHLGETPFIRVGNAPKSQLLYRVDGDDVRLPKWSVTLVQGDEENDIAGQSVEWLSHGSLITSYGLHHKTKQSFDWSQGSLHPAIAGPEHAPIVTKDMLRAFVNALQQEWPSTRGSGVTSNPFGARAAASEFQMRGHGMTRHWTPRVINGDWTTDKQGHVTDGAENWMTAQSWALCAANAHSLHLIQGQLVEWLAFEASQRLLHTHRDNAKYQSEGTIQREAEYKIRTAAEKWLRSLDHYRKTGSYLDGMVPWSISDDGRRPVAQRVRAAERPKDGSLDWIPDDACPVPELAERNGVKVSVIDKAAEDIEADRAARALIEDKDERQRITDGVSAGVRVAIAEWLSTVPGWTGDLPAKPWVLKAPTGAGKTVSTIDELAAFSVEHPREPGQGPVLVVLPTHANADEAMSKAVDAGMFAPELWTDEQLEKLEVDMERRGVKIVRFRGRGNFCKRDAERQLLADKGIGVSRLCGAEVEDGDELDRRAAWKEGRKLGKVELLCPFRERGECGYYKQMSDLQTADIVVLPHAYLTIAALPMELRKPRAVIIDESVTYALLRQSRMPVSALSLPRREPYVTKTDRKMWPEASDEDIVAGYVNGRDQLCQLAKGWLAAGKDVAAELKALPDCADLLQAAITTCERANDRTRKVRPDLTPQQIADIAAEATGSWLLDEIRLWKLVRDRIERLAAGTAKGQTDMRWQVVEHPETTPTGALELTPHLRLSWRVTPNWAGYPMLLLDASANTRIVTKLLGAEPEVRTIDAPLHVRTVAMIERTWSNSSFVPRWDASDEELKKIGETVEQARRLITTTAVMYGHGRVLVGTTIAVREVLTGGAWVPPPNVDFVHFGALRGLDFAKSHVAAISIGRSEQPIGIVDGYAAALTFDDDDPEPPVDKLGTGLTAEGKPLFRVPQWRRISMRTGEDVDQLVPCMPARPVLDAKGRQKEQYGKLLSTRSWGQDLEKCWREEELRQFLGRLRPVYRGLDDTPPPVWIAVGKILPDGIIFDELADMQACIKAWPMAELIRLGGGVLADNVTPMLPGAQEILQGRDLKGLAQTLPRAKKFLVRWAAPFEHVKYRLATEPNVVRSAMLLPGWYPGGSIADHWMGLSERYGELPEVLNVTPPKLVATSKVKPKDKRDADRDDQLLSEIEIRDAHYTTEAAHGLSRAEFEIRRARGEFDSDEAVSQ
jgi:hypothetical protein